MNLAELVSHTRCSVLRDTAVPQLWSNTELIRFLNFGYKDFAIRTHNIIDDTTAAYCTFDTVVGQDIYELNDAVLLIDELGIAEYDVDNVLTNYTPLRDCTREQGRRSFISGRPCRYTAQVRTKTLRLLPTPDAVYTIEMVVARKPKKDLAADGDVPEIAEEYHLNLCDFAAWRALTNNDPDGSNMVAAKTFRDIYDLAVRDAKRAFGRQRLGVNPQARSNWTGKR
jgi:hypothetical protein